MPFSIPEHIACLHTAMLYSIMDLLLRTPYSIKWWGKTGNKIWQNLGRIWIKKGWQTCKTSSKSNSSSSDDSQEDRRGSDWLSWPQSEPEASKGAGANGGKAMWGMSFLPTGFSSICSCPLGGSWLCLGSGGSAKVWPIRLRVRGAGRVPGTGSKWQSSQGRGYLFIYCRAVPF